jgi:hypothetical protein
MSARYYDAGSGPHDAESAANARGERNCGCRHDGLRWESMCAAARAVWETERKEAAAARAAGGQS